MGRGRPAEEGGASTGWNYVAAAGPGDSGGEPGGRGGQIRTDDIRVPNAALYQAELRPVHGRTLGDSRRRIKNFLN